MFEDSTFESAHRIKSKSGRWMLVTGGINTAILILLILIPLIYPEALPEALMSTVLTTESPFMVQISAALPAPPVENRISLLPSPSKSPVQTAL